MSRLLGEFRLDNLYHLRCHCIAGPRGILPTLHQRITLTILLYYQLTSLGRESNPGTMQKQGIKYTKAQILDFMQMGPAQYQKN